MKKLFLILSLFLVASCGGDKDWKETKHDNAITNGITLPETRPQEHRTPKGVKVYWNGTVSARQMQTIDEGIALMWSRCHQDTNQWQPADAWKNFKNFKKYSDFAVILVPSTYRSVLPETLNCPLMGVGVWGTQIPTCGTISAVTSVNGKPVQRGGAYLILPFLDDERNVCFELARSCVANEAEHQFFMNDAALFWAYVDGQTDIPGGHPYCRGME